MARPAGPKQQARNARARAKGFDNDYRYRKAVQAGKVKVSNPRRLKSAKTIKAQAKFWPALKKVADALTSLPGSDVSDLFRQATADISKEQECRDWSAAHAITNVLMYETKTYNRPKRLRAGEIDPYSRRRVNATTKRKIRWIEEHGIEAYTEIYFNAFVLGDKEAKEVWFIEVCEYLDQEAYDDKYKL